MERMTFSVEEAGERLGLGRNSVYEAVKRGDIPSIRIGGRILVPRQALERLLDKASDPAGEGK
jgi:excisionase family DNA binding protein